MSATEKKLLNNTIQSMEWFASIKPVNANIPAIHTSDYIYEEIQIMVCTILDNKLKTEAEKCSILFQKYIPYQMVVLIEDSDGFVVNVCDKRINANDTNKRTIEKYISTPIISKLYKNKLIEGFYNVLDFKKLDKTNLETLYKSYIQVVVQFQSASITGQFKKRTHKRTEEDMANLQAIGLIEKEIISLTSQIKKEKQLNSRVVLNIEIQNKRKEIQAIKDLLTIL